MYFLTRCIILFSYVKAFDWNYDIIICFFIRSETTVWYSEFDNEANYSLPNVLQRDKLAFHWNDIQGYKLAFSLKNGTQCDKLPFPWNDIQRDKLTFSLKMAHSVTS